MRMRALSQIFYKHVCSRLALISLHRLCISLLIEFGSKTMKQKTAKNKYIRYLCFIAADFIHSCHHCLKISSCSFLEKNRSDLLAINVTTAFTILNCLEQNCLGRIFGPSMTEVTLNILRLFKYPGLRVMSSE